MVLAHDGSSDAHPVLEVRRPRGPHGPRRGPVLWRVRPLGRV